MLRNMIWLVQKRVISSNRQFTKIFYKGYKMKKLFFLFAGILLVSFVTSKNMYAQELSHGNFGISAAFNGLQGDILFPIWAGNYNTIAPTIGVMSIGDNYTDLSLGLVFHHYIPYSQNFSPFLGLRGGALIGMPSTGDGTTDYFFGVNGGGEYFFSPQFSVGIEAQLNFTFSDDHSARFGNPGGTNFNTGSVIFAAIYF